MLNMMPLSRHVLSLQTRLHRQFILGTIIPPTLHPNLVLIDGSEEYEVESIVDSKYRYRYLHYLVKFKGWPDSDNEWLPANHLANAPDIMQDFHLCYPSTPTLCHMSHLQ